MQLGSDFDMLESLYLGPFWLLPYENPLSWSGAIHLKIFDNFGFKFSYLQSGTSRVLACDYQAITSCLKMIAWPHLMVMIPDEVMKA